MDLKRKLKRFFSFRRRSEAGFTLVELIVVIAILAILGGVAVPVYSGYIAKTNLAADQKLLAVVNRAFASACVENGANVYELSPNPVLALTNDRAVQSVSLHDASFQKYYAGNEEAKFKTDYTIIFDNLKGAFILFVEGEMVALRYGDGYVTVSASDAQKLKESSFADDTIGLGPQGLLDKVDFVTNFAAAIGGGGTYAAILQSREYKLNFLKNLGLEASDDWSDSKVSRKYESALADMINQELNRRALENGWTEAEKESHRTEVEGKLNANMAVLYAAQNTSGNNGLDDDQIESLLNSDKPSEQILAGATGKNLSQAALYYGMYTAYAYSSGDASLIAATNDPVELLKSMDGNTADFKQYVASAQGQKDLEAYLASMNVIVNASQDAGAVGKVLTSNFNDEALVNLFRQIMGN